MQQFVRLYVGLVAQDAIVGPQCNGDSGKAVLSVVQLSEVAVHNPCALDYPFLDDCTGWVEHLEFEVALVADGITHTAGNALRTESNPFHDSLGRGRSDGVTERKIKLLPHISAGHPCRGVQERDFDGVDLYVRSVSAFNGPLLYTQV